MSDTILTAAAVVVDGKVHRPGWLEIAGDRIGAAGQGQPHRPADVDLGDQTVVPGFVDIHCHGGGGGAFTTGSEAEALQAARFHRTRGTTTMLASLVTASPEDLQTGVKVLAGLAEEGEIAGIHLEGPWLSDRRAGAHPKALLRDPDPAEIAEVLAAGRGHVRMVTLAPERHGALDAIRQVLGQGAIAAIGHTDATYAVTRAALDAGASVATHLYNAMRPPHHREPGPVVALIEDPDAVLELVLDDVHLHPAVFRQVLAAAGPDRIALVTDAMAAAGMTDGAYPLGSAHVTVKDGTARVRGTDTIAGSTATGDELFRRAVAECGYSGDEALLTAVRLTSATPAQALGLTDRTGAVGGRADLVVLDSDLCPSRVMIAGIWRA